MLCITSDIVYAFNVDYLVSILGRIMIVDM